MNTQTENFNGELIRKSHNVVELESNGHGELLEMEEKLKILSESKLTAIVSFNCESNI